MSLSGQTITGMNELNGPTDSVTLPYGCGYHGDEPPNSIESSQRTISVVRIFPIEIYPKKTLPDICVHMMSLMLSCHPFVPNNRDPLSRYSLNQFMLKVSPVVEKRIFDTIGNSVYLRLPFIFKIVHGEF